MSSSLKSSVTIAAICTGALALTVEAAPGNIGPKGVTLAGPNATSQQSRSVHFDLSDAITNFAVPDAARNQTIAPQGVTIPRARIALDNRNSGNKRNSSSDGTGPHKSSAQPVIIYNGTITSERTNTFRTKNGPKGSGGSAR